MANKYSRYQLNPFPSLYVDDRKIEISQLLAQRYDQNKQSHDLIDRTLSQMQLLDGDKAHGERVKSKVKEMLNQHIEKGDWENSSLVVADAANMVSTDQGLIAANMSFQNRQAEINAIREARINGVPMIDFGADSRKIHESYVYNPETETYETNIYEPMAEKMLDYRSRKQHMIGKIPADQRGAWKGVTRGKTNRIANMVVEQYIADTPEGIQEYKYLVEIALPQTLPIEERMKMAKKQILQDFKEVAQQQEFNQVVGTGNDGGPAPGKLPNGITIKSNVTSPVSTEFDKLDDKIRGLQEENLSLLNLYANEKDPNKRQIYQNNITENNRLFEENLQKVAKENGVEGQRALDKYNRIKSRFMEFGTDGERLLAATQYLTYNTNKGDTDWGTVITRTTQGAFAGGTLFAGYGAAGGSIAGPGGTVVGGIGLGAVGGAGGGVVGFVEGVGETMFSDLRNVRDIGRRQEPLISSSLGDSERDQLKEELWGDEDLEDMKVEHANKLLGTNFKQSDMEELMKMTNAYYTFMIKDGKNSKEGKRLTGDELMSKVNEKQFTITQPTVGFDMTDDGKKLRTATNSFVQNELNLNNAGLTSNGLLNPEKVTEWIDSNGGSTKLQLDGVRLPDLATNTPLKLTFGFQGDGSGENSRDFYVTDPAVVQPGGWVYELLDKNMNLGPQAYDEALRQEYNRVGYDNVTVNDYVNNMAYKNFQYGGGGSEEDLMNQVSVMQDEIIMDILLNPDANLPQYPTNQQGIRTVEGPNGQQIPFMSPDGSFNQAAWIVLSQQPDKLASLRNQVLSMSLPDFAGTNF